MTKVSPFPSPTPSLCADGRRSGLQLSGWAGAGAWAPALGSRSRREKARKGRGWPGRGLPSRARLESAGTDREGSAVAGGLTPWSQRAGIAPRARRSGAAAGAGRGASANLRSERAGSGERTNLQSLRAQSAEGRHPSMPRNSSSAPTRLHPSAPAAQPIRRFRVLASARSGCCCHSPPCPRRSWSAPGSGAPAPAS